MPTYDGRVINLGALVFYVGRKRPRVLASGEVWMNEELFQELAQYALNAKMNPPKPVNSVKVVFDSPFLKYTLQGRVDSLSYYENAWESIKSGYSSDSLSAEALELSCENPNVKYRVIENEPNHE